MSESGDTEDIHSQNESSIRWFNMPEERYRSWGSDSSNGFVVMVIHSRKKTELKVAVAKLPMKINGRQTSVCIDSGSPISIFTIGVVEENTGHHRSETNGLLSWQNNDQAKIKVIGYNQSRLSIVRRDLMSSLGLQLIQKTLGENVKSIQGEQDVAETLGEE